MKALIFPNRFVGNPFFPDFIRSLNAAGVEDVRLADVLRLKSDFDVAHFHFPEQVVTEGNLPAALLLMISVFCVVAYAKITGRPIVWMVHDVKPLRPRRNKSLAVLMYLFKSATNGYVFLNHSSQAHFYSENPGERPKSFEMAPIGRFNSSLLSREDRMKSRANKGVESDELLVSFVGDIKPYKGIGCAAHIPEKTNSGKNIKLAICGQLDHGLTEEYVARLVQGRRKSATIRVATRPSDDEVADWIQCSDIVLIPYLLGSNSGMALNVLSNHGKILASPIPMFKELEREIGKPWIICADLHDPVSCRAAIVQMDNLVVRDIDIERLEVFLESRNPISTGRKVADFYHKLRGAGGRP
jgi:beta-1,4-mannosyltransferase